METRCRKGDWVLIQNTILAPSERSEGVPPDTALTPLLAWMKGEAQHEASPGQEVEIKTTAGRVVKGLLVEVNPIYDHSFGPTAPEVRPVGQELRNMLRGGEKDV